MKQPKCTSETIIPVSNAIAIRYSNNRKSEVSKFWFPSFAAIYRVEDETGACIEYNTVYLNNCSSDRTNVVMGAAKGLPFVRDKGMKYGYVEELVKHVDRRLFRDLLEHFQREHHKDCFRVSDDVFVDTKLRCLAQDGKYLLDMLDSYRVMVTRDVREYVDQLEAESCRLKEKIERFRATGCSA